MAKAMLEAGAMLPAGVGGAAFVGVAVERAIVLEAMAVEAVVGAALQEPSPVRPSLQPNGQVGQAVQVAP